MKCIFRWEVRALCEQAALCKQRADAQQDMHGLWHVSGEPVCWSLPPCTVVSQLEFSGFGRLTQKPGIEVIFTLALRSGALRWKGSPQARVRNAMAAILNHLNSARSKGQASREIPTSKGLIFFWIGLAWKRTNCFEGDTAKIVRGTVLKAYSTNCTNVSMLTVYWKLPNISFNMNSRYGKPQTTLQFPLSKANQLQTQLGCLWPNLLVCPAQYLPPRDEPVLRDAQTQQNRKLVGRYPTPGQDFPEQPGWKSSLKRA